MECWKWCEQFFFEHIFVIHLVTLALFGGACYEIGRIWGKRKGP